VWPHTWFTWTDGQATVLRGRRQAANGDRLQAGIDGSGGGGQAKIAMSCQGRGLRGRTDDRRVHVAAC